MFGLPSDSCAIIVPLCPELSKFAGDLKESVVILMLCKLIMVLTQESSFRSPSISSCWKNLGKQVLMCHLGLVVSGLPPYLPVFIGQV